MSRFNTNNPIDSDDYRDGSDNLKTLDQVVNSSAPTVLNRFGVTRPTLAGVEARINEINSSLSSGVLSELIENIGITESQKQDFAESLDLLRAVNNPVTGRIEILSTNGSKMKVAVFPTGIDDSALLQGAIDSVGDDGAGEVVIFPSASLKVVAPIHMRDGVTVLGFGDSFAGTGGSAGTGAVVDTTACSGDYAFLFDGVFGAHIKNLHINGSSTNGVFRLNSAPDARVTRDSSVEWCSVNGASTVFSCESFSYFDIEHVSISSSTNGVVVPISGSAYQEFLRVKNTAIHASNESISIAAGSNLYFDACDTNDSQNNIHITGGYSIFFSKTNCTRARSTSIYLDNSVMSCGDISFRDTTIHMYGQADYEVAIKQSRSSTFVSNAIYIHKVRISKSGEIAPTKSIEVDTGFTNSLIEMVSDSSGGKVSYPGSLGYCPIFVDSVKRSGMTFLNGDGSTKVFSIPLSSASPYDAAYPMASISSRWPAGGVGSYIVNSSGGNMTLNIEFGSAPTSGAFQIGWNLF